MFRRNLLEVLEKWKKNPSRKPLILRGARQVGKTTVINLFSKSFDQYIYLNLEKEEDSKPFREINDTTQLLEAIFFLKNTYKQLENTLVFIDEIQEEPKALSQLRYFYEEYPQLHVIAAGSLLETVLVESTAIPVGRVEYLVVQPVSFDEFLQAIGERSALQQLQQVPINNFAHEKLLGLFHAYTLIGGMPEIVNHYSVHGDLTALAPVYESLIVSYLNDVEKYARNSTLVQILRHCIKTSYLEAGSRIKFQGFGNSNYGSREVGEALRTLEKTMLLYLVYPTVHTSLPILPDLKKSPRLQVLDTGLLNHFAGLQKSVLGTNDLQSIYQGKIAEHIVGQEILASGNSVLHRLNFWIREKKGSSAEVDYVVPHNDFLIPVEVKSGSTGKLRSLHLFMDKVSHPWAIRLYSGSLKINSVETLKGKKFTLLDLPYYLTSQLDKYILWLESDRRN